MLEPVESPLHLHGLNLIDVQASRVRSATSVTILDGRISAIGEPAPREALEIDLSGCWATPGLVDMHAHITFDARSHHPSVGFDYAEDKQIGVARAVANMTEAVRNGICLIRDAGGRDPTITGVRRLLEAGAFAAPELVTCGEPICRPEGHGLLFGRTVQLDQLPRVLADHISLGHEWLKIMNGPELWPQSELRDIVKAAQGDGLRVAVHAFTPEGVRDAILCGADTVEHALVAEPDLIEEAKKNGTVFVPTYYCSWSSLRHRFIQTQPPSEVAHLRYWRDYLDQCRLGHLAHDLPVLPGTDAGCAPCSFDDYVDELAEFESWGLAPLSILHRATLQASEVLGRSSTFGSIDLGKWANIIITEQSPVETTKALRNPLLVLNKGIDVYNSMGTRWL